MRILVLGAGATGGYFGGRLLEAGRDVTFLVRGARAALLRERGLTIRSPHGDVHLKPPVVIAGQLHERYDLVLLCCKAYDLDSALEAIAPAVGAETIVLPLLNGMRHFDALDARLGAERVLGGLCSIAVTVDEEGRIQHFSSMHVLRFGERDGRLTPRVKRLQALTEGTKLDAKASRNIVPAMWEKWTLLAAIAGINCLMRAGLADILAAPGGRELCRQMLEECCAIAAAHGHAPRSSVLADVHAFIEKPRGDFTTSMLRDLEAGRRVEADHILGDLIARGEPKGLSVPLLRAAYCHLKIYEARRARKAARAAPDFASSPKRRRAGV
jgi:2-dehydropantoate 2-reductase